MGIAGRWRSLRSTICPQEQRQASTPTQGLSKEFGPPLEELDNVCVIVNAVLCVIVIVDGGVEDTVVVTVDAVGFSGGVTVELIIVLVVKVLVSESVVVKAAVMNTVGRGEYVTIEIESVVIVDVSTNTLIEVTVAVKMEMPAGADVAKVSD